MKFNLFSNSAYSLKYKPKLRNKSPAFLTENVLQRDLHEDTILAKISFYMVC